MRVRVRVLLVIRGRPEAKEHAHHIGQTKALVGVLLVTAGTNEEASSPAPPRVSHLFDNHSSVRSFMNQDSQKSVLHFICDCLAYDDLLANGVGGTAF